MIPAIRFLAVRIHVIAGGLLVIAAARAGSQSPAPRALANWTGAIRCEIQSQATGYAHQETQTWTLTGAPTVQGSVTVYPATWTVTGQGWHDRTRNTSRRVAQWTVNIPGANTPRSAAIGFQLHPVGGGFDVARRNAQLTTGGGYTGPDQFVQDGVPQPPTRLVATVYEWQFPKMEGPTAQGRVTGTNTAEVRAFVGPLQPEGAQSTVSCAWALGQRAAPPLPPSTLPPLSPPQTLAQGGAPPSASPGSATPASAPSPPPSSSGPGQATIGGVVGGGAGSATAGVRGGSAAGGALAPGSTGTSAAGAPASGGGTQTGTVTIGSGGGVPQAASATPPRPPQAAPGNVAVRGTPIVAHLTWSAAANAQQYAVWRRDAGASALERTPPGFVGLAFDDTIADPRVTYSYTVTAYDATGASGDSPPVSFVSPAMTNPTGFTATYAGNSIVNLTWQPVDGALRYRVDGPGLPNTGVLYTTTSATLTPVPSGALGYKVTALFPGNYADYATASVATVMVRQLPARSVPFLSKNNGTGSQALTTAHYDQLCPGGPPDCLDILGRLTGNTFWGDPLWTRLGEEAVYANVSDLGFGRRTNCRQQMSTGPRGLVTTCYATSHGAGPGAPGFADSATITRAAAGEATPAPYVNPTTGQQTIISLKNPWGEMPRTGTVIIKTNQGTSFYAFTVGLGDLSSSERSISWTKWAQMPSLEPSVVFDSEGPKAVPHSCLSCHGGRWNATTQLVDGATLLPLDPNTLVFGKTMPGDRTKYERSGQEERIRRINQIIAQSAPGTAVASYISGLYGGAVGNQGAVSRPNYVPQGWATQSGLYQQVVKPYCANCHLAAPSSVNFASWANFYQNRALIYNAVCVSKTMPHSEIAFRSFWTKDTGPLFLPGLLASTLGYPSCS